MKEAVASRPKKKNQPPPHGWEDFIQVIANSSIPKSFFTKRSTVKDIERLRQHTMGVGKTIKGRMQFFFKGKLRCRLLCLCWLKNENVFISQPMRQRAFTI